MNKHRTIPLNDILDVVNAAETYGYVRDVLMCSLYEWANPVTDADIEVYAKDLSSQDGYTDEDYDSALRNVTEWRDKYRRSRG